MKPAVVNLIVSKSLPFNDVLRIMQPMFIYKKIEAIASTAPVRMTVSEHGLLVDWIGWIVGVKELPDLNRQVRLQAPHRLTYIDSSTLEVNAISAVGQSPKEGQLIYQPPIVLAGMTVKMNVYKQDPATKVWSLFLALTSATDALVITSVGTITRFLPVVVTNTFVMGTEYKYTLDVVSAAGTWGDRYFEGKINVSY